MALELDVGLLVVDLAASDHQIFAVFEVYLEGLRGVDEVAEGDNCGVELVEGLYLQVVLVEDAGFLFGVFTFKELLVDFGQHLSV